MNSSAPLDTMDLTNTSSGYNFSGGNLLSGFTNSSDEEDEEMEEGETEQRQPPRVDDEDQVGELSFEDVEMDYR
jgi:SIT4-associating protein SAP185/190